MCVTVPNFVPIGQTVAEISRFLDFQDGARRHFGFLNFKFVTVIMVKRVELHHYAKFRRNRCNRGRYMAIFRFSKWRLPPCWIFEITNF